MFEVELFALKPVVLVVGNPLVKQDSLPLKLLPRLRASFPSVEFREFDPAADELEPCEELVVVDTVVGIAKVKVFGNIDFFQQSPKYSLHDFDLGSALRFALKAGVAKRVKIVGVPPGMGEEAGFDGVAGCLRALLA